MQKIKPIFLLFLLCSYFPLSAQLTVSPNITICAGDPTTLNVSGGTPGNALDFDRAQADFVELPILNLSGSSALTLEAWVNPTDITSHTYYNFIRQDAASQSADWLLAFQNSGTILSFGVRTANGWSELDVPITASNYVNQWNHVAGVYDGTTQRMYVNGILVGTKVHGGLVASNGSIHRISGGPNNEFFEGQIDDVRLWSVARTASEILDNHDLKLKNPPFGLQGDWRFDECSGPIAFDLSGNSNDGVLQNSPTRINMTTAPIQPLYCWSPSTTLNVSTGATVIATPPSTTTYTVMGVDPNCNPVSAQVTVTVVPCPCPGISPYSKYCSEPGRVYSNGPGDETLLIEADGSTVSIGSSEDADGLNVLLTKLDPNGNFLWSQEYGNPGFDDAGFALAKVSSTASPGYILVGTTNETGATKDYDVLMIRTDLSGQVIWSQHYGYSGGDIHESGYSVYETAMGGFVVGGWMREGPNPKEYYALLVDGAGNLQWANRYSQSGYFNQEIRAILEMNSGEFVFVGNTNSPASGPDFSLFKLDMMGNTLWSFVYDANAQDKAYDLIETMNGGFAITGEIAQPPLMAKSAAFLMETDAAGNPNWLQTYIAENDFNRGVALLESPNGGYAIGGMAKAGNSNYNRWLLETDASGMLTNSQLYTDKKRHNLHDLDVDACGYVLHGTYRLGTDALSITRTDLLGQAPCLRTPNKIESPYSVHTSNPMVQEISHGYDVGINAIPVAVQPQIDDCILFQKASTPSEGLTEEFAPAFNVFPNPVHTGTPLSITMELTQESTAFMLLLDAQGKTVWQRFHTFERGTSTHDFQLESLPAGLYTLGVYGTEMGPRHKKIHLLR